MSDKYAVLWSGGFDSTYMIQHLLESQPKSEVEAHYVTLANNALKTDAELAAISALVPLLKRRFGDRLWVKMPFMAKSSSVPEVTPSFLMHDFMYERRFYNNQLPLMLAALAAVVPPKATKAAIGYVIGDTANSFLGDLQQIWQAYGQMSIYPWPELVFPLSKYHKNGIAANLWPDLRALCVCCERDRSTQPGVTFCHSCPPCTRNREAGLIVDQEPDFEL